MNKILFYFIMFLIIGSIAALLYFVYYDSNRAPFITPVYAQMGDFYMLPEPEPEQPNMAVSRQATESVKVVSSTMERCNDHISALNFLMMAKCLEFMKNWNATLTEFNQNNSMTILEIMLGHVQE